MNKKFLSAILFGALMVTSTGTFVSCKDYDDDIDELNSRVDAVESQIKDLQSKIDAGKWITGVTPSATGLTFTLSDGNSYTVTNGTNGTEWSITEDGYWACNGEKTDVKAVGEKGEQGPAGLQEVKFENGVWKLWNGTEFVEFKAENSTGAKIPYCYTDPNDPNYTVLVVYTQAGEETLLRMPMNSGLAQINVLSDPSDVWVSYYKYTGTKTWGGALALPAQGEYLIVQPVKQILVQVTPSNYDMSHLSMKLVNAAGKEAPVVLGAPVPYEGYLGVQSRAVSKSGIYSISVEPKDFTAATLADWKENFRNKGLSLIANESVRSTYNMSLTLSNPADNSDFPASPKTIAFGNGRWASTVAKDDNSESVDLYSTVGPNIYALGEVYYDLNEVDYVELTPYKVEVADVTFSDKTKKQYYKADLNEKIDAERFVYDAFITVDASSQSDSIKAGMTTDGLKIVMKNKIDNPIKYYVSYVDAKGHIYTTKLPMILTVRKYEAPDTQYGEIELAEATHQSTSDTKKQSELVDLKAYFDKFAATDEARILWNSDANIREGASGVWEKNLNAIVKATWEHVNADGDIVIDNASDLINTITFVNADGEAKGNAAATHLKVQFANNYGSTVSKFEDGTLNLYATVTVGDKNGTRESHTITIPMVIKNPTAADIAEQVTFNPSYYSNGVLTILNASQVTLGDYVSGLSFNKDTELATGIEWSKDSNDDPIFGTVTLSKPSEEASYNKEYSISKAIVTMLGSREFEYPAFKVKFVKTTDYRISIAKALAVVCDNANPITIKYGDLTLDNKGNVVEADKKFYTSYKFVNFAGVQATNVSNITFTEVDDDGAAVTTGNKLAPITVDNTNNVTITTVAGRIANDITVNVKVSYTIDGKTYSDTITVTVKASL